MHYARWLKTGSTDLPPKVIPECGDPSCTDRATRCGLCEKHYRRKQRAENGDQIRATRAAWRDQNREHVNAVYADWEKRNPDKVALRDRRNKARRRAVIGNPDTVNYEQILAEHGMVCHLCGQPIDGLPDLHFDHVIPLALGGCTRPRTSGHRTSAATSPKAHAYSQPRRSNTSCSHSERR